MTEERHCARCGVQAAADSRFCSQCGRRLDARPAEESTVIYLAGVPDRQGERRPLNGEEVEAITALPLGSAFLISPPGSASGGGRYLLDSDRVTVGRHPDNDICLDDITVSRHHLELRREAHRYYVHDLASLNGTYLNYDRVELAALHDGDDVRVGKFVLVYYGSRVQRPD